MADLQDDYKLSDAELAAQLRQQHEVKQVSDYKFPTEIIELPSRGLIYPKDNPLSSGKIEMKYMTAKEEDILTTQSYIRDGSVLDRLFQSLIISNGEGQPIKYVDLVTGDKNAIMIAARILGYGKDYEVEVEDPYSNNKQKETIDLTQFENKDYDGSTQLEPNKNEFEFTTPIGKNKLIFKLLTHGDENLIEKDIAALEKFNKDGSFEITTRLRYMIQSIDGNSDLGHITKFINNMLARDSKAFRNYVKEIQPDMNMNYTHIHEDGEKEVVPITLGVNFFWPAD